MLGSRGSKLSLVTKCNEWLRKKSLASKSHNLADDQLDFENELKGSLSVMGFDRERRAENSVCVILSKAKSIKVQNYQV